MKELTMVVFLLLSFAWLYKTTTDCIDELFYD